MKKLLVIATILFGVGLAFLLAPKRQDSLALDSFARCLADQGITMYGADWCRHCQNEKKAFGNSFSFVPYIECPDNPKACLAAGITGFPTWIFPDGKKLEGEQGLEKLSRESGCPLPDSKLNAQGAK